MIRSIIGKPITGKLLLYVGGGVAVVVVGLFALLAVSRLSIGMLQRDMGALKQSAAQMMEDNQNQTERLSECVQGFTNLAGRLKIEQTAAIEANARARIRDQERLRELDLARQSRSEMLRDSESCSAWWNESPCAEIWSERVDRRNNLLQEWSSDEDP